MRVCVSWSGGKDAAWALRECRRHGHEVAALLATLVGGAVTMHGTPRAVVELQAAAVGAPLETVELPPDCPDAEYRRRTGAAVSSLRERGIAAVVFGDLHLADVRAFREEAMAGYGVGTLFPLWGRDTAGLAREMVDGGLEATVVCVDSLALDRSFLGRPFDRALLVDLPRDVDPCGENGEFHTVVTGGPMLTRPVPVELGPVRDDGRFARVEPTPA